MKCFKHQDVDAVAICRGCAIGVCGGSCSMELSLGFACSESCAERVRRLDSHNEQAFKILGVANRNRWLPPAFSVVAGIVMGLFGWEGSVSESVNFMTALGAVFVIYGVLLYVRGRR